MITLYGFKTIFAEGIGETKDLRAQWALEEFGLPYRVHGIDHLAGEHEGPAFSKVSPFHQVPVIEDDGFVVAESAAIVLYLAEKAGKLKDVQGRTRVTQWCFAAAATIAPTFQSLDMVAIFDADNHELADNIRQLGHRWLSDLERRLEGRAWIATDEFSAADIMMAGVLRNERKSEAMKPFPNIQAYYERCFTRPAWERTLVMYAERLGVTVEQIR